MKFLRNCLPIAAIAAASMCVPASAALPDTGVDFSTLASDGVTALGTVLAIVLAAAFSIKVVMMGWRALSGKMSGAK